MSDNKQLSILPSVPGAESLSCEHEEQILIAMRDKIGAENTRATRAIISVLNQFAVVHTWETLAPVSYLEWLCDTTADSFKDELKLNDGDYQAIKERLKTEITKFTKHILQSKTRTAI